MRSWEDYKKTMVEPDRIWTAAKEGRIASLQLFLDQGVDIHAKDHRGYSPLMLAAYSDQVETVFWLLSRGADPNSADFGGNTVLMGASFKGHEKVVRLLLASGADVSRQNAGGMDALDFAVTFGRENVKRLLELSQEHLPPRRRWKSTLGVVLSRLTHMYRSKLKKRKSWASPVW